MNDKIVGRCSLCGGLVAVSTAFWVKPSPPQCQGCHAAMDVAAYLPAYLPIVPMVPPARAAAPPGNLPRCAICRDPNCSEPNGRH